MDQLPCALQKMTLLLPHSPLLHFAFEFLNSSYARVASGVIDRTGRSKVKSRLGGCLLITKSYCYCDQSYDLSNESA